MTDTPKPDTVEAVEAHLRKTFAGAFTGDDDGYWKLVAKSAIAAHEEDQARQGFIYVYKDDVAPNDAWIRGMNEQGYVIVKPVKITQQEFCDLYSKFTGTATLLRLQNLGLPIEITE